MNYLIALPVWACAQRLLYQMGLILYAEFWPQLPAETCVNHIRQSFRQVIITQWLMGPWLLNAWLRDSDLYQVQNGQQGPDLSKRCFWTWHSSMLVVTRKSWNCPQLMLFLEVTPPTNEISIDNQNSWSKLLGHKASRDWIRRDEPLVLEGTHFTMAQAQTRAAALTGARHWGGPSSSQTTASGTALDRKRFIPILATTADFGYRWVAASSTLGPTQRINDRKERRKKIVKN